MNRLSLKERTVNAIVQDELELIQAELASQVDRIIEEDKWEKETMQFYTKHYRICNMY